MQKLIVATIFVIMSALFTIARAASVETESDIYKRYFKQPNSQITRQQARQLFAELEAAGKRETSLKRPQVAHHAAAIRHPNTVASHLPTLSALLLTPNCVAASKALFIRSDPLDDFHYLVDPQATADAQGASVSYTDNLNANTQAATINGKLSYLLLGEQCSAVGDPNEAFVSGVGIAPFVSSNGTWSVPLKAPSTNAERLGADFQLSLSTSRFPLVIDHYFYASPFYQTDFAGRARVEGADFAWEPVAPMLFIDSGPATPYYSFFTELRAEAELTEVSDAGLTDQILGEHSWFGETARATLALFPLNSAIAWPDWIGGRFSIIGSQEFFWDARTESEAAFYSATLQYKLGECKIDSTKSSDLPCAIQGASSVSLEYDWGRQIDTLVNTNQILAKLSYAY